MSTEEAFDRDRLLEELRAAMDRDDQGLSLRLVVQDERLENVAEILHELELREQQLLFDVVDPQEIGSILREVDEDLVEDIAETFPEQIAEAVVEMAPDDAADVLESLPLEQRRDILRKLPPQEASTLQSILHYQEDTAGGIMTTEFILLWQGLTAGNAIKITQRTAHKETVSHLFVADETDTLVGYLPLHRLVFAKPETELTELMAKDVITVTADVDQEEVLRLATKFNLEVVPVVDGTGQLIGVITPDDILEVAEEEMNEDMYLLAGMDEQQDPVRDSLLARTRVRLPWLLISLIGGVGSAFLVSRFEGTIGAHRQIVFFMPLVALIGGNVAIQASTLVVRGLATGQIAEERIIKFVWHEMAVTLVLALSCGLSGMALSLLLVSQKPALAVAVAAAIGSAVCVAGCLGMLFPLLCHKLGVDPAVSAGPFVTILNDLSSVLIYLYLAGRFVALG